jgi:hypothetical protein
VLVQRVSMDGDLHPFPPAGDNRQHRGSGVGHPHGVQQLRHMLFGSRFFRDRRRQRELGLEHGAAEIYRPSSVGAIHLGMLDSLRHVLDRMPGVAFIQRRLGSSG